MHEMPLAEGILEVVLQVAEGQPVRQVRVRAGALQRVVPDSLQFCFELAAAGTPAEPAYLDIEIAPDEVIPFWRGELTPPTQTGHR